MAVHIPVATTTSITSESPVLERSSPRPIRTHLRTTPVVPPTVWPPPSPPKSPTSRPKSPPLGSPLQPPPLFAPWRRRPTPYCFTYDAGNRPREKPRERDIPKASSPNVSRDGSPRSSRHHRPSQQHHAKYSTSATGSPRTQRTQQQADVNQSEESPIVMEIDENTDVSGISHSDQIPIITEVDDGNDTADTSTPTPKRWFSKSLDTGVLFIRSIVTYTLTAVILVVWIAFTVYVFFMSYVFSALYAIARRCPALLQAALRGAKKGAQLAFEISVKAYRVGKDAYETAFRIWTDYASPCVSRILPSWPWSRQEESQEEDQSSPFPQAEEHQEQPEDEEEPADDEHRSSSPAFFYEEEQHEAGFYPTPSSSPIRESPAQTYYAEVHTATHRFTHEAQVIGGTQWNFVSVEPRYPREYPREEAERIGGRNPRWSASSGSSGYSLDSGYTEGGQDHGGEHRGEGEDEGRGHRRASSV